MEDPRNLDTRYRVHYPEHGPVNLSYEEYMRQLGQADRLWSCPICGASSRWDDDHYERHLAGVDWCDVCLEPEPECV